MKKFKIYQLPIENKAVFMDLEFVIENGIMPTLEDYKMVYEGEIFEESRVGMTVLDEIFQMLNIRHPEDYKARSLSVSDVVELDGKFYYCDSYNWAELDWKAPEDESKEYIVVAFGSCKYIARYQTREEALAKANQLNNEYYQHKIWNVEEI